MANHKSALKRNRQNIKRRLANRSARASIRTAIKSTKEAVEAGDQVLAKTLLQSTEKVIARAAAKGLFHKLNAQRKISRLATLVAKGKTEKKAVAKSV